MHTKNLSLALFVAAAFALAGCYGTGDTPAANTGGNNNPSPTNPAPTMPTNPAPTMPVIPADAPTLGELTAPPIDEDAASRDVTLTATATDPEASEITYQWLITGVSGGGTHQIIVPTAVGALANNGIATAASGATATITFTLAAEDALQLTANLMVVFEVTAEDADNKVGAAKMVTLTVNADDDAPEITRVNVINDTLTHSATFISDIESEASDENPAALTFAWSLTGDTNMLTLIDADTSAPQLSLVDELVAGGTAMLSLIVTDAGGNPSPPNMTAITIEPSCTNYDDAGTTRSGTVNGDNCVYDTDFVDTDNPLTLSARLGFGKLPNGGAHIFDGSLVVGESDVTANLSAAVRGGRGPTIRIVSGAIMAFKAPNAVVVINRGSGITAQGDSDNPIIFTSDEDVMGDVDSTTTGQWGGIYISGFAVNTQCDYSVMGNPAATVFRIFEANDPYRLIRGTPILTTSGCDQNSINSDPIESLHGGTSSGVGSGTLQNVIIKHAGGLTQQGAATPRLNALTLSSVGSRTRVSNVQIFAAAGNGIVVSGGEVSMSNLLLYNVEADGILLSDGYFGRLDRVLVSQADNSGEGCLAVSGSEDASTTESGLLSRAFINRLTCDVTPTGSSDAAAFGVLVLRGGDAVIQNSLIVGSRTAADAVEDDDNVCISALADASTARVTRVALTAVVLSCFEGTRDFTNTLLTGTRSHFAQPGDPTSGTITELTILTAGGTMDTRPLFSLAQSASTITAIGGARIPNANYTPEGVGITYLGAISRFEINPFARWTVGVFTPN